MTYGAKCYHTHTSPWFVYIVWSIVLFSFFLAVVLSSSTSPSSMSFNKERNIHWNYSHTHRKLTPLLDKLLGSEHAIMSSWWLIEDANVRQVQQEKNNSINENNKLNRWNEQQQIVAEGMRMGIRMWERESSAKVSPLAHSSIPVTMLTFRISNTQSACIYSRKLIFLARSGYSRFSFCKEEWNMHLWNVCVQCTVHFIAATNGKSWNWHRIHFLISFEFCESIHPSWVDIHTLLYLRSEDEFS